MLEQFRVLLRDSAGLIWDDEELSQYLTLSLDYWNMHPPVSAVPSIEVLLDSHPAWRVPVLHQAIVHAVYALDSWWSPDSTSGVTSKRMGEYRVLAAVNDEQFRLEAKKKARAGRVSPDLVQVNPTVITGMRVAVALKRSKERYGPDVGVEELVRRVSEDYADVPDDKLRGHLIPMAANHMMMCNEVDALRARVVELEG